MPGLPMVPRRAQPRGWGPGRREGAQQEPCSECHRPLTPTWPHRGEGGRCQRGWGPPLCSRVPAPHGHWLPVWPPAGRAVQAYHEADSTGPAGGGRGRPISQTLSRGCLSTVSVPADSASVSRLAKERRGGRRAWGCRPPPRKRSSWSLAAPPRPRVLGVMMATRGRQRHADCEASAKTPALSACGLRGARVTMSVPLTRGCEETRP